MPTCDVRLYFDNSPADAERLDLFSEIRVDQAIGLATEAELQMDIGTDEAGAWSGMEDSFAQPFSRVRVEVKVGDGEFVPLIDGPVVGQRFELSASPEQSKMVLVVQDDSVLLNREEKVALYEDMAAHEIAQALISEAGLTPEVDSTPAAGSALPRAVVQRGTNMQLLRDLARRHGMFAYVKPGETPGKSVGVFAKPQLVAGDLTPILLTGKERNVSKFSAQFDALRPMTSSAGSVTIADIGSLSSEVTSGDIKTLGDEAVHEFLSPLGKTLLARTREEQTDIDAATQAVVNLSSWAYQATAEVDAESCYSGVLQPYQVLNVTGVGGYLSGEYLISRVTHVITDEGYRQQITLRRNARSKGVGATGPALPGGLF